MHFSLKDFKKYIIFVIWFAWLLIFSHLFYVYITFTWEEKAVKWWVFLEWVIKNNKNYVVNPLPYIWNNYHSKYVQHLLYRSCLNSFWSWDLCNIKTTDYKTFKISLSWNNLWSDWKKITLDDLYFTYNNVIKDNSFGLENPIPNNLDKIQIDGDILLVSFKKASINNKEFFKKVILPEHILKWKDKNTYVSSISNLVNSTCVKVDPKSDYRDNLILDYSDCSDYYINKYQFILLDNITLLNNFLTWSKKIDIYNGYENINKNLFNEHKVKLKKRYAFFWNTKSKINKNLKVYFSHKIINHLKDNLYINNKLDFNGYGLFILPKSSISWDSLTWVLWKGIEEKFKKDYENKFVHINWNILKYNWWNKSYFKKSDVDFITVNWILYTWGFDKVTVSSNWKNYEYTLKSYKWWKDYKYVMGVKYKNLKEWKNTYIVYAYKWDKKEVIWKITLYYKKLDYPKFDIKYPEFTIVYLDKWLIKDLWEAIASIVEKVYPWKVNNLKLDQENYEKVLKSGKYDLVISSINFEWKDISSLFETDNPIENPSLFMNKNFASLINQTLIAPTSLKWKIHKELIKIYQEKIPLVIIWNEKMFLYFRKKYNFPDLDYSYYENREKILKTVILNKITEAKFD